LITFDSLFDHGCNLEYNNIGELESWNSQSLSNKNENKSTRYNVMSQTEKNYVWISQKIMQGHSRSDCQKRYESKQ